MPSVSAALLSDARVLAAYLIFLGSYIVFALGKFPGLKIDRPGAAIIGATLMVAFRIVDAQTALGAVDFATMVLLFSMMLVVSHVRVGGLFDWIAALVIRKLRADHLLGAVVIATGVLSAFLVNDIVCLVMTPMVINLTRRLSLPPLPYLLAVASASNIGSVATITGNPQNMLIGSLSHIPYVSFMARLGPVAVVGLLASWIIIHLLHRTGHVTRTEAEAIAPAIVSDQKLRAKPIIVLALVLAGFLGGAPPALAASVGAACTAHFPQRRPGPCLCRSRLGTAGVLCGAVRHRRRSRTRRIDHGDDCGSELRGTPSAATLRDGNGGAEQHRQQRAGGDASARHRSRSRGPAYRMAGAGHELHAGG